MTTEWLFPYRNYCSRQVSSFEITTILSYYASIYFKITSVQYTMSSSINVCTKEPRLPWCPFFADEPSRLSFPQNKCSIPSKKTLYKICCHVLCSGQLWCLYFVFYFEHFFLGGLCLLKYLIVKSRLSWNVFEWLTRSNGCLELDVQEI